MQSLRLAGCFLFLLMFFVTPATPCQQHFDLFNAAPFLAPFRAALNWPAQALDFGACQLGLFPGVVCNVPASPCINGLHIESLQLGGPIPAEIGNFINLVSLNITNTLFHTVPDTIHQLVNLVQLDLSNNALVNGLEHFAEAAMPALQSLNLANNKFVGSLPVLGNGALPALTFFSIARNALTDIANAAISFAKSVLLTVVDFSLNLLKVIDQTVLTVLNTLNSVLTFILSGNLFNGNLLSLIEFLASLPLNIIIDLSDNFFCGLIPPLASRIVSAERLILNGNCFFNPLPNWCSLFASTCSVMKPASVCNPVIADSACPPVMSTSGTIDGVKIAASLTDGPSVRVLPVANGVHATTGIALTPTTIMEIDSNGNPVGGVNTTQKFPAKIVGRYYVNNLTLSSTEAFQVSTILDNGAFFFWEAYLSNISFTKKFVATHRSVQPNKASQLIEISYWPPKNPKTVGFALDFELQFDDSEITEFNDRSIRGTEFSTSYSGSQSFTSEFLLTSANRLSADVTLVNVAYSGIPNRAHNITHLLQHSQADGPVARLRAVMPFTFNQSLHYDPDVGVLLGGFGSGELDGEGDGDGGSSASQNLIIGLSAGLGGGGLLATIVIALIVVGILYGSKIYNKYWAWRRVDVVNWGPADMPYAKMEDEEDL